MKLAAEGGPRGDQSILIAKLLPPLSQAKGKTSEAITKLCQLAPPLATLLELDEQGGVVSERELPTDLVHRGDVLKVLPGARIPTDGIVLEGSSYADESMLTGESGEWRRWQAGWWVGNGADSPADLKMSRCWMYVCTAGALLLAQPVRRPALPVSHTPGWLY
jgi:hypothetical protein